MLNAESVQLQIKIREGLRKSGIFSIVYFWQSLI